MNRSPTAKHRRTARMQSCRPECHDGILPEPVGAGNGQMYAVPLSQRPLYPSVGYMFSSLLRTSRDDDLVPDLHIVNDFFLQLFALAILKREGHSAAEVVGSFVTWSRFGIQEA